MLDHVSHFIFLSQTYSTLVQKRRHMRDEEGGKERWRGGEGWRRREKECGLQPLARGGNKSKQMHMWRESMKEENQWNIRCFCEEKGETETAEKSMLARAESAGEKRREALHCTTCCETRWRTSYCLTTGGGGERQSKASGLFLPMNRGLQREEKSAALSDKSRMGPWRRQHPGEQPVKVISKSVGV